MFIDGGLLVGNLAQERADRLVREAEQRALVREAERARRRENAFRRMVGVAVIRLGAWVAGRDFEEAQPVAGRLSSAG